MYYVKKTHIGVTPIFVLDEEMWDFPVSWEILFHLRSLLGYLAATKFSL